MPFIRYKTIGGKEYAYEITSYWDKEGKRPRQRSRYLGVVVDREKGIYVNPYKTSSEKLILDFGDSYFLVRFMESNMKDLYSYLLANGLLPLVLFRLTNRSGMSHAQPWYEGNVARYLACGSLSSQKISELLSKIGDEGNVRKFFQNYLKASAEGVAIDTTALPNQIDLDLTQWGYSSDKVDEELKLILVIDRSARAPLYFRYVPGGIVDVSMLTTTVRELQEMRLRVGLTVLDAGFFSEENISLLASEGIDFLIRVPANRSLYRELMESVEKIEEPENAVIYGERALFISEREFSFAGRKVFLYLVLDPERRGRELRRYIVNHRKEASKFAIRRKGYMVLMSSVQISREELIPLYYTRQFAEKAFSYSKDDLAILPLRVHGEETLRGYLFLIFISLIVYMKLQNCMGSVSLSLDILRNLKCKVFEHSIVIQEPTRDQKELFDKIKVIVPKVMGI